MTVSGRIFGHPATWDDTAECWRYCDTGIAVDDASPRPCPQCGLLPTANGHDPCIGYLPGAYSVCCGHGVERGYILWEGIKIDGDNVRVQRSTLIDLIMRLPESVE